MIDFPETHKCIATEARVCDKHGSYSAQKLELIRKPQTYLGNPLHTFLQPFWTKCPTCDGEIQAEVDTRDTEIRNGLSVKDRLRAARLRSFGIPTRYDECTIWNWKHTFDQQKRVWNSIRDYCSQFDVALQSGRCVTLYGATGCGKTHLAVGILRHVADKGGTGHYTTALDLVGAIRSTYGKQSEETEQAVINRLSSVDLLVIDELGRQQDSTHEKEQVWRILDRRYAERKPTVLVSNLSKADLTTFLGQAMVDRLLESGGVWCVFDWPSSRSKKGKAETTDDAG